jgi:uncharacterized membrane protein YdjX (TVP38/TMEM64 family)
MLRADLLAEHLGTDVESMADTIRKHGLLAAIREHQGRKRTLQRLDIKPAEYEDVVEPLAHIADLEKPMHMPQLHSDRSRNEGFLSVLTSRTAGRLFLAALVLTVIGWAVWTALQGDQPFDPKALLAMLREKASHPLAPLLVIPAFVAGSIVIAPVTGMIALCALLFTPWIASLAAIAGTLASTLVNYEIGRHLGKAVERRAPRNLLDRMRAMGRSADTWSLAGLRMIPVAPFAIVNLLAGTAHVPLRPFLLGTVLAMGPGIVLICYSVDRARAALAGEPLFDPWVLAVIIGAGVALIGMRVWQKRRKA